MSAVLSEAQFGPTLGDLHGGEHIHLPGHDGTLTVSRVDNRAGKARLMYRTGSDSQEFGYIGASMDPVQVDR